VPSTDHAKKKKRKKGAPAPLVERKGQETRAKCKSNGPRRAEPSQGRTGNVLLLLYHLQKKERGKERKSPHILTHPSGGNGCAEGKKKRREKFLLFKEGGPDLCEVDFGGESSFLARRKRNSCRSPSSEREREKEGSCTYVGRQCTRSKTGRRKKTLPYFHLTKKSPKKKNETPLDTDLKRKAVSFSWKEKKADASRCQGLIYWNLGEGRCAIPPLS